MLRLALTPRWLGFLALVLVLASAFVGLSAWQVERAQHKNEVLSGQDIDTVKDFNSVMEAQGIMPAYLLDQRVELSGHYLPDAQVVLPGRVQDGEQGFWVVTMFVPDGARYAQSAQFAQDPDGTIAVPVLRGWTADEQLAMDSRASAGEATIVGRLGPVEGPLNTSDLPEGQVHTLSTSQLVNLFDVHTYSGVVFPEQDSGPGASEAVNGLAHVTLTKQESGGLDLQSAAYAAEWLIFAAFAVYIWWRLLRDEHQRLQAAEDPADTEYIVVKPAGQKELVTTGAQSSSTAAAPAATSPAATSPAPQAPAPAPQTPAPPMMKDDNSGE